MQFLLGHHPGKYAHLRAEGRQRLGGQALQLVATDHRARRQTRLIGNRAGRNRAVASNHHDPHPSPPSGGNRPGHLGPERIGQANQPQGLEDVVVGIRRWLWLQ